MYNEVLGLLPHAFQNADMGLIITPTDMTTRLLSLLLPRLRDAEKSCVPSGFHGYGQRSYTTKQWDESQRDDAHTSAEEVMQNQNLD